MTIYYYTCVSKNDPDSVVKHFMSPYTNGFNKFYHMPYIQEYHVGLKQQEELVVVELSHMTTNLSYVVVKR